MSNQSTSKTNERPYGWVIVGASLLLMGIGNGGLYVSVVALKLIAAEFDWPRSIPSLGYSLAVLGMGFGGILMGRWSDRSGVVPPAMLAAVAIPLGAYMASFSQGVWGFVAAHAVLIGFFGIAGVFAPLMANVTRWFDNRRGLAVGIVGAGQALAGAVWPPVFRLLNDAVGWRDTFVFFALFALATMAPLILLLRPRPPAVSDADALAARGGDDASILGFDKNVVHGMLCFAGVGCCVAMAVPMVHIVAHATDLGYSHARAAELLAALLGSAFISRLIWGAVSDRIGGLGTLMYGSLCQALVLAMFVFTDSLPGLYLASVLFGLGFGGIVPAYTVIVRELFPVAEIGWRIGVIYLFSTVGMAIGGVVGGTVFDLSGGYAIAFVVGILFNLGNLALVVPLARRDGRRRATAFIAA